MANNYTLRTRIKSKYDSATNYETANPILLQGEIAIVNDNGDFKFKVGYSTDGTEAGLQRYKLLPFWLRYSPEDKALVDQIPDIKEKAETQPNWTQSNTAAVDFIKNKPDLKPIATSANASDLELDNSIFGDGNTVSNAQEAFAEIINRISAGNDKMSSLKIKKLETPEAEYFSSYKLYLNGKEVSDSATINIPKDYLVKSASVKTCSIVDTPVSGYKVGDKYIDFVVNTVDTSGNESHIYLKVQELVDVYTSGNGITVATDNSISIKLNATKTNGLVVDANGLGIEPASATSAGAMSASHYKKLENIEEGANKYVHPTDAGYKHLPAGGTAGQILTSTGSGNGEWKDAPEEVKSSLETNKVKINSDKTMEVNSLDISKLSQEENNILIIDCGNASGW